MGWGVGAERVGGGGGGWGGSCIVQAGTGKQPRVVVRIVLVVLTAALSEGWVVVQWYDN